MEVRSGVVGRDFTTDNKNWTVVTNENAMVIQTLEINLTDKIYGELGKVVDTVQDRIPQTILAAVNSIVTLRVELAVRFLKASFGQDFANVMAISEREEQPGVRAVFQDASDRIDTFHEFHLTDETRGCNLGKLSELRFSRKHFDQQSDTHHIHCQQNFHRGPSTGAKRSSRLWLFLFIQFHCVMMIVNVSRTESVDGETNPLNFERYHTKQRELETKS